MDKNAPDFEEKRERKLEWSAPLWKMVNKDAKYPAGTRIKPNLNSDERGERNVRRERAEGDGWSSRFTKDTDDREGVE